MEEARSLKSEFLVFKVLWGCRSTSLVMDSKHSGSVKICRNQDLRSLKKIIIILKIIIIQKITTLPCIPEADRCNELVRVIVVYTGIYLLGVNSHLSR